MPNHLGMDKVQSIEHLHQLGWSLRRIAEAVGVDRKSVRRHLLVAASKGTTSAAEAPTAPEEPESESKGTTWESEAPTAPAVEEGPNKSVALAPATPRSRSSCSAYHEQIVTALERRLTAQRIYQDLVSDHGYSGTYWAVNRYVKRLQVTSSLPFRRMEVEPGEEAQIDFGKGAPYLDSQGKKRRCHVLRVVLSQSRKAYSEVATKQSTECFLRILENAFHAFGGVPRTLVVDNLKAAVIKADWFDPDLNPKIVDFCKHYSTTVLPTKPRMPRHKGKVERGVAYVQDNALKGRVFPSLAAENEFLQQWERNVADTRIHGTTKQHVGRCFLEIEKPALQQLPADRFPLYHEATRTVARDGHIEVAKSFYSMPPEYITHEVWVRWDARTVRAYSKSFQQIAIHARIEPGKYSTHREHIASEKISSVERGTAYLLQRVSFVGPHTTKWAEAMIAERGLQGTRVLQGLLSLTRKYSSSQLEAACEKAWRHRSFRLNSIKKLIDHEGGKQQLLDFAEEHWLIRSPHEYGQFVHDVIQGGA